MPSNRLLTSPDLWRAMRVLKNTAEGDTLYKRLLQERDILVRQNAANPQGNSREWYQGRIALLFELIDGFEGRQDGHN
jgi:hypothetical protein